MKNFIIVIFLLISQLLIADGINSLNYNPDPKSANIKQMGNLYMGFGDFNKNIPFGVFIQGSMEFPFVDPNLTLGPEFGMGYGFSSQVMDQMKLAAGVRAAYYADWLIPQMPDQFDVFVANSLGFYYDFSSDKSTNAAALYLGFVIGGRYHFSPNTSLFAQMGSQYSGPVFNFGLSIILE